MTDKGKRAKVEEDEGSEALDAELVMNIEKLQEVQDELEKVNEEASDKVLEVEQKYNEVRRPVYNKRNQIIQNIPDFWLTAFLSHPVLCEILTEDDQKVRSGCGLEEDWLNVVCLDTFGEAQGREAGRDAIQNVGFGISSFSLRFGCLRCRCMVQVFKYLQSLDVEDFKDVKSGYSITFTFKPNPYFEDTRLIKVFRFSDEGTISVNGTAPRWKDGMDLTNGVMADKEGSKRLFSQDSFFKWFKEVQVKDQVDGASDEVAEVIKEDLWPNPLKYFNNEADEEEYDDEEGEEEDDDGVE